VLVATLVVADVGVRRVRVSALDVRAGYAALRRRLGYVDDLRAVDARVLLRAVPRPPDNAPPAGDPAAGSQIPHTPGVRGRRPAASTQSGRLLAAKQRAARR
jgi:hypothetical protein